MASKPGFEFGDFSCLCIDDGLRHAAGFSIRRIAWLAPQASHDH